MNELDIIITYYMFKMNFLYYLIKNDHTKCIEIIDEIQEIIAQFRDDNWCEKYE